MAKREIKSHKKATNLNLTGEMEDLLGMSVGSDSMKLKSADDLSEPSEKVEKSSVAAVEATINYVNKLLNENDEDLPEDPEDQVDDEDPTLDDVEDGEEDLGDDEDEDDVEECGRNRFSEDDESLDDEDLPEDDEEDLDDEDMPEDDDEDEDEDMGDEDLEEGFFREDDESLEDDEDDEEDLPEDEDEDLADEDLEDDEEEDMDDVSEGYFREDDESLEDDEDMGDESSDALTIDIPEDVDPNDVSVTVGGSEYVPEVADEEEDMGEDEEDLGDLDDDELADEEDDDMDDAPVQEGFNPFSEAYFSLGEDDEPDVDDADPEYDDDEFDDEEEEDEDDFEDDVPEDDDEADEEEVTESSVMRALRRLIREGERSDDSITGDPSDSTGDAPIDSESDIDDSEAEEDDLSGSEGEVTDGDIPITPGTIQPEEAAELKWMAKRLKKIMEGDEDTHKEDGKTVAEPLDDDAQDMIGDLADELSDDGELTDTGNGAVEDGETTLGSPDDEDDDVEVDGDDVVSSNGERYDDEDERLTDNYHMLMKAIKEAYSKKKKKDKKFKLKKVAKKGKKKKLSEGSLGDWNPSVVGGDYSTQAYNEKDFRNVGPDKYTKTSSDKQLENTVLGSFNAQEMTSVLRNLNNAFGTGKIAKEVKDSNVVTEVSVPKWSLPIAENASWDSIKAGKMLMENAFKSASKVDFNTLKKTHLYWENQGLNESDYKFPIGSIVEGKPQIIPEAINEATQLFASPSFITRFSESALKKIRNVLDFYNNKMGKTSPWKSNKQLNVTEAAKITMIDRTQYNPYAVLKRLSEQEKAKNLINLRG